MEKTTLLFLLIIAATVTFISRKTRKVVSRLPKNDNEAKDGDETIVKDDDKSKDDSSKDDKSKDDSSSKSKVKEALSEAKEAVAQTAKEAKEATKTAKNIISQIFAVLSSMFWWSVLFGIVYLFLDFGISMYQGASEFMSDSSTPTSTPIPLNRIVDGDYVPDKTDGTYLFTMERNKSYRIKVSGTIEILIDGKIYNRKPYSIKIHSDGFVPTHHKKFYFSKKTSVGSIKPYSPIGIAVLVIKNKKNKIIKKEAIGKNLYTLHNTNLSKENKVYLYINLNNHETVIGGEWHVVVDEI